MVRPLAALALLAAAAPAPFRPGLWQVTSNPTSATLNGRPLRDLPYTGLGEPQTVCLTASAAADAARWLARDVARNCALTRRVVAGGHIDIAGTCLPQQAGQARGTVRLTGRYTATTYDLRFATANPSENGVMGFTGTVTARRVGECRG